ncbi:MAG: NAD(+) synthase [Desulforudis sp.]|jgi:NAD+ synthase|nr:NAD(+) synthase [Clostridia bacterium]RJX20920.1 MAG: NAD(+) synthase [Desulforudis sp.]
MQQVSAALTEWLKEKVREAGAEGLVIGLSGGIDSSVAAALAVRAFPQNTLGIIMPCFSNPQDALDAKLLAESQNIPTVTVCLDEPFLAMLRGITGNGNYDPRSCDLTVANIKPRLRMSTLYYFAASRKSLVVGTLNKTEIIVGFYTKYGDGGTDLSPLANLLKRDVRELARYLGVPQRIIDKAPSAGLWHGHCDETEMGVTYQELDEYLGNGQGDERVKRIIKALIQKHKHKRDMPLIPPV